MFDASFEDNFAENIENPLKDSFEPPAHADLFRGASNIRNSVLTIPKEQRKELGQGAIIHDNIRSKELPRNAKHERIQESPRQAANAQHNVTPQKVNNAFKNYLNF